MRFAHSACAFILAAAGAVLPSSPAAAGGGYYEINEACRNIGCFPGDNPATETIEITSAATVSGIHSFRLTGRLVTNAGAVPAIRIDTDDVTIDLQGHQLFCNSGVGCSSDGGAGIRVEADHRATIRNGNIRQYFNGIRGEAGTQLTIENMFFSNMAGDAVRLQYGSVRDSRFSSNRFGILSYTPQAVRIAGNLFVDDRAAAVSPRQYPLIGILASSACAGNVVVANNHPARINLASCTEVASNLCGSARCGLN